MKKNNKIMNGMPNGFPPSPRRTTPPPIIILKDENYLKDEKGNKIIQMAEPKPTPKEVKNDLIKLLKIMPSVSLAQNQPLSELLYELNIKYNVPIKPYFEITNHKSRCCKAFVHYKHIETENFKSSEPYCSNCGEFPKAPLSAIKKALQILLKKD